MKGLLVICLLGLALTLTGAAPRSSGYKIYKNRGSKDAIPVTGAVKSSDGDVAAILSKVETTTAAGILSKVETTTDAAAAPAQVPAVDHASSSVVEPEVGKIDETVTTTKKSKLGDTPFGEPTPRPTAANPTPPAFPPKPESESALEVTNESAAPSSVDSPAPPSVDSAAPPSPPSEVQEAAPSPPATPAKVTNGTVSEEDDSSSEEDDADENDGRTLISKKKAKSVKFPVSRRRPPPPQGRAGLPKNPPLKYDLIINGFVTEDGQVLVPLNTYNKYFHNGESTKLPLVYAITRDESQAPSTNAVASEEADSDKSSEEKKGSSKPNPASESSESSETPAQGSGSASSEEVVKESPASEEKEKPAESEEKETQSNEVVEKPAAAPSQVRPEGTTPVFRPPLLQAIPARLPTDEDDEEEAGRYLDQYGYLPPFDYEDDEPSFGIEPHPAYYFGY